MASHAELFTLFVSSLAETLDGCEEEDTLKVKHLVEWLSLLKQKLSETPSQPSAVPDNACSAGSCPISPPTEESAQQPAPPQPKAAPKKRAPKSDLISDDLYDHNADTCSAKLMSGVNAGKRCPGAKSFTNADGSVVCSKHKKEGAVKVEGGTKRKAGGAKIISSVSSNAEPGQDAKPSDYTMEQVKDLLNNMAGLNLDIKLDEAQS